MSLLSFKEGISVVKKEQYGLTFYKVKNPYDGAIENCCKREGSINEHNNLQILQYFSQDETEDLIESIENALNGQYYEEYFTSDPIGFISIRLVYPNVIIGKNGLIISMQDLLALLQEWLAFIS